MDKNKKVPEIRFRGFEEEWSNIPLKDISYKITDKNFHGEYSIVFTNSAEMGIIDQKDYFDRNVANDNSISGYYVVRPNDFVYNPRISSNAPVGPINRNKLNYTGVMSPLYYVFRMKEESIDYKYLDYFFKSSAWHPFMYINGNSGARSDRFSISDNIFAQLPISSPCSDIEQKKIGAFLTTLDTLIRKLEQKLEKLRNIKQSLLNQMFVNVNRGGYVPLIRYKNQTYHWNEMSAEEIFHTYYDKNHPDLPVVSASQEYGMVFRDDVGFDVQHDKANEVGYKRVLPGQFVIHLRSFQGGFAYSEVEGITSPAYTIIEFKDKSQNDGLYWKYVLSSKEFIKRLETVTYGIRDGRSISFEDFAELKFMVPQKEEQKQIGKLLLFADCNSRRVENKITKLRTMKQSLLQKMFV